MFWDADEAIICQTSYLEFLPNVHHSLFDVIAQITS